MSVHSVIFNAGNHIVFTNQPVALRLARFEAVIDSAPLDHITANANCGLNPGCMSVWDFRGTFSDRAPTPNEAY